MDDLSSQSSGHSTLISAKSRTEEEKEEEERKEAEEAEKEELKNGFEIHIEEGEIKQVEEATESSPNDSPNDSPHKQNNILVVVDEAGNVRNIQVVNDAASVDQSGIMETSQP